MEEIKMSVLKLMNLSAGAVMNGNKADLGANREYTFDALLEQKNSEARSDVVTEKGKKPETAEQDPRVKDTENTEETKETETPVKDKTGEENCDIAREAAVAQMIWSVAPNAAQWRVGEKQDKVAGIEQPMIIVTNDNPAQTLETAELVQLVNALYETEETAVEEFAAAVETEIAPELTPELAPELTTEIVPEEPALQTETGTAGESIADETVTIRVTGDDSEEIDGESAVMEAPLFKDVETAPIKVAEAPKRAEDSTPVDKQVSEKLTDLLDRGETKVEIQLEPIELGRMTIELRHNADGTLNILLNAENAETRSLLERHAGSLYEALNERGQQNVQITVNRGEESQRQDGQQQNNDFQDGGNNRQNEQQQRRDNRPSGDNFLQQLRLGLIPLEEEEDE